MSHEDLYVDVAISAAIELQEVIDAKIKALEARDYDEAYRLAGVVTLLAGKQEQVDRLMHLKYGSGEEG
jgi:hypothetical protein